MSWFIERTYCPVCHDTNVTAIFSASLCDERIQVYLRQHYAPVDITHYAELCEAPYQLDQCKRCQTVFQHYILNDALMTVLYEEWIRPEVSLDKELRNMNLAKFRRIAQEIMTIATVINQPVHDIKVLDYGMGWGYWCRQASLMGLQAYGSELSPSRLKYAHKHNIQVLPLDNPKQIRFDFINTEQVFEHLPQPLETLKELRDMLKGNGIVKISVPNGKFVHQILEQIDWGLPANDPHSIKVVAPLEHINCYQQVSLPIMARQAGLEPIQFPLTTRIKAIIGLQPIEVIRQLSRTFRPGTYQYFRRLPS